MQAPPPTTLDPETQRQLQHAFDHVSDPVYDLARILVVLVGAVLILFVVAVIFYVGAQWKLVREKAAGE
ncbi:MAG TPA: hypothetical protein VKE97_03350 [Acidimicrobiia bacterium]|jgi:type VI protein secretion system component VasF|nr:hypothetical protein [Acidimicrobiia bacterium]